MVGEVFREGPSYRYREFIRDASRGGEVVMDMSARCVDGSFIAPSASLGAVDQVPIVGHEIVPMIGDGGTFKVPVASTDN